MRASPEPRQRVGILKPSQTGDKLGGDDRMDLESIKSFIHYEIPKFCRPRIEKPDLTTMAVGEEGGCFPRPPIKLPPKFPLPRPITTLAMGEEGGGPPVTTKALGEEGGTEPPPVTTRCVGEEGGVKPPPITTMAIGEEGGEPPIATTLAIGEEGGTKPPVVTLAFPEEGGRGDPRYLGPPIRLDDTASDVDVTS